MYCWLKKCNLFRVEGSKFTFCLHITLAAEGMIKLTSGDSQFAAKAPVFQAALQTTHDIDTDSAMGTSIVTDDRSSNRSSCRLLDDEEVSKYVYT